MNPALDPEQIAEVCRLAILATPFASRSSAHAISQNADDAGVTVMTGSQSGRAACAQALRQHGYRLAELPADERASGAIRIVGWRRDGLAARVTALADIIAGMERALPATIEEAARRYPQLQGRIDGQAATYGVADALRADVERRVARRVGPLPRRRPSRDKVPDDVRALLDEIDHLTGRARALLAEHWCAAVRTADRLDQLHHRSPPDEARERAVAELRAETRQRRHASLFRDAHAWATRHLTGPDAASFAEWYVAEYARGDWTTPPYIQASARWIHQRPASAPPPAEAPRLAASEFPARPRADAPAADSAKPAGPARPGPGRSPGGKR